MSIREELISIAEKNGGTVRPETALEWAEHNADSSLYAALDAHGLWDDDEAARFGRLEAMRHIIRRVKVKIVGRNDKPIVVRAFVSVPEDRNPNGGFRDIKAVLESAGGAASLLASALRELESMQRRYEHLAELAEVFAAADRVKAKAARRKPKTRAAA